MAAPRKAIEPRTEQIEETAIATLDDGSTQEFPSEGDARAAHPRAWVRLKSEALIDKGGG